MKTEPQKRKRPEHAQASQFRDYMWRADLRRRKIAHPIRIFSDNVVRVSVTSSLEIVLKPLKWMTTQVDHATEISLICWASAWDAGLLHGQFTLHGHLIRFPDLRDRVLETAEAERKENTRLWKSLV